MRNIICLVAAVLLAVSALAQGPGMGPGGMPFGPGMQAGAAQAPNFDALKTYLGLSDAQVQSLLDLRKNTATSIAPVVVQAAAKGAALKQLLDAATADPKTVGDAVIALNNIRKQIEALKDGEHTAALKVLTASQLDKLKGLEDAQKLEPAIRQAIALDLLTGPDPMHAMMQGLSNLAPMLNMMHGR